MKKKSKLLLGAGACLLIAFALWTVLVLTVDIRAIGPHGSEVGFASLNEGVHKLTGANMTLYEITDWLGIVPIGTALCFGVTGLVQWIRRRSLFKVDRSLLLLGGFYIAVMATFVFFEIVEVNYRPVLINGCLEASYPSSTAMLVLTVMPTAIMQCRDRVKSIAWRRCITLGTVAFIAFMLIGRILSGVHWITDIIGGVLISAGLVAVYAGLHAVDGAEKRQV